VLDYVANFLLSPARVFTAILKLMILAPTLGVPIALWQKGLPPGAGLIVIPWFVGGWMILTLSVYGPQKMMKPGNWREWLWRHITVWWDNIDEVQA